MSAEDVSDFLTRVLKEQDFDFHNPEEVIYWYCYSKQLPYSKAEEYKENYKSMEPAADKGKVAEVISGRFYHRYRGKIAEISGMPESWLG